LNGLSLGVSDLNLIRFFPAASPIDSEKERVSPEKTAFLPSAEKQTAAATRMGRMIF
jgi:hypothetical protein